jgi:hypothetical protein
LSCSNYMFVTVDCHIIEDIFWETCYTLPWSLDVLEELECDHSTGLLSNFSHSCAGASSRRDSRTLVYALTKFTISIKSLPGWICPLLHSYPCILHHVFSTVMDDVWNLSVCDSWLRRVVSRHIRCSSFSCVFPVAWLMLRHYFPCWTDHPSCSLSSLLLPSHTASAQHSCPLLPDVVASILAVDYSSCPYEIPSDLSNSASSINFVLIFCNVGGELAPCSINCFPELPS